MAEYTAGVAKIEIRPNLAGFKKRLEAELERINQEYGVKINPDLSDFREQLRSELANLPSADVEVDADTAAASAKIDKLGADDKKVTVTADADTAEAQAGIDYLTRDQTMTVEVEADTASVNEGIDFVARDRRSTVEVDADTAAASAQIAFAARDRRTKLDLDMDTSSLAGASAGIAAVGAQAQGASASVALLGAQATGLGILAVAAAGCVGPLAAVASAAAAAVGSLAVLPGVAASATASIAALGVGVSGVGKAFQAMGQSASGGAAAAVDNTKQLQRQVEAAERGVVQANRRIEDAERRVADAQKNTRKAQEALNDARKEAVRDLKELKDQLSDAALNEEEATLAVARARQNLIDAQLDKDSTNLDIAEADLAHRKAVKNLDELREKNNQLARDVQSANEAGVEGSKKVQDAKEKVEAASQREADAQRGLLEAHENAIVANERLADALEKVGEAGAGAAGGGVDPFAEAMAKLSPNAREFVLAMQALGDQWTDLRLQVQDNLFEGMGEAVTNLATAQLPILKTGLAEVAAEINTGLRANIQALASESSQAGLGNMLANTAQGFSGLNQAAQPLVQAMVDIGSAGSNYLPQIGQYLGEAGARFGEFLTQATQTGQFDQWVQNGVNALKGIGDTLGDIGGIISGVWGAATAAGQSSLGPMSQVLSMMNDFINSTAGQGALGSFFSAMTDGLAALMPILSTALQSIGTTIMPAISDFIQQAAPGVQVLVQGLADGLSALAPVMGPIGSLFGAIGQALAPLLPLFGEILATALLPLANGLTTVIQAMAPVMQILAGALQPIIQQLAPVFQQLVEVIANVLVQVLQQITPYLPQLAEAFGSILAAVIPLLPQLIQLVFQVITPFIPILGELMPVLVQLVQAFGSIIQAIMPVIQVLVDLIGVIARVAAEIVAFVARGIAEIATFVATVIAKIAQFVADIIGWFTNLAQRAPEQIRQLGDRVERFFTSMWDTAVKVVTIGVTNVVNKVREIKSLITGVFDGASKWLINAGKVIISGLWDGMKEMWDKTSDWFSDRISSIRSPFSSSRRANGSYSSNAMGAVSYYAAGGEDHSPQIAAAGEWRVWAEPETGGEAYIPLANDYRRGRAVEITAAVANHFGYNLVDAKGKGIKPSSKGSLGPTDVRAFAEGGITIEDLDDFSSDLEGKPYIWGGVHWGDCSGAMSGIARFVAGLDPWGGRFATGNQREALAGLGFLPGLGGAGALSMGWFNGGPYGGHTAGTLPSGTNVEMGGGRGNGQFGGHAAGAADPSFTDHAHVPAEFFAPIKVPKMAGLGNLDFGDLDLGEDDPTYGLDTDDPSAAKLRAFRASKKSNAANYVNPNGTAAAKDGPSTISEMVADVAKTAVAGHTKDILGIFGVPDDIPMVKAYGQWLKARRQVTPRASTSTKKREITSLSQAAADVIDADPGIETVELTGLDLVGGLSPIKEPKADDGDIGHIYVPGGGAEQWRGMAMAAMRRVGFDADNPAQVNAMIAQIQSESGGDPNIAQQIVDVNGTGDAAGVGLLQIIPTTYEANRDPDLPNDRRNPFSNMVAALRYYRGKYGTDLTTMWGHGHGYWAGGLVQGPGGPTDDLIPAMLSNNEFVVREAAARHARPLLEAINSDPQRARQIGQAFSTAVPQSTPAAVGRNVELHYHIETNNVEEGMRRSEMHARQQVMANLGI